MFIVLIWLTCIRNNPVEWNNWYWTEWTVCAQYPERLHHDQTTFLQSDAQLFLFFLKTFYLKYATILLDWFFLHMADIWFLLLLITQKCTSFIIVIILFFRADDFSEMVRLISFQIFKINALLYEIVWFFFNF